MCAGTWEALYEHFSGMLSTVEERESEERGKSAHMFQKTLFTDSHCHLNHLDIPVDEALERARSVGIGQCLTVGTGLADSEKAIAIARAHKGVWATVGIHPCYSDQNDSKGDGEEKEREKCAPEYEETLLQMAQQPGVVAIGETGLDKGKGSPDIVKQADVFRAHLRVAEKTGLPVVIHSRDAYEEILEILQEVSVCGVFHCYTQGVELARRLCERGFMVSLSGIVTFKKCDELRHVARFLPDESILLETDAPWLSPEPFRGKPNYPERMIETARCVATERRVDLQKLAAITSTNFTNLFPRVLTPQP